MNRISRDSGWFHILAALIVPFVIQIALFVVGEAVDPLSSTSYYRAANVIAIAVGFAFLVRAFGLYAIPIGFVYVP